MEEYKIKVKISNNAVLIGLYFEESGSMWKNSFSLEDLKQKPYLNNLMNYKSISNILSIDYKLINTRHKKLIKRFKSLWKKKYQQSKLWKLSFHLNLCKNPFKTKLISFQIN